MQLVTKSLNVCLPIASFLTREITQLAIKMMH